MTSLPLKVRAQQTWNPDGRLTFSNNDPGGVRLWNEDNWWANPGGELYFGTSGSGTVSNNMTEWTDFGGIFFNSGAASFTITGNFIGLANTAKIENNSANTQTVSLTNISLRKASQFNPVEGNLTIGSANIFLDGFQLNVWGNKGFTLEFSSGTIISGAGSGSTFAINAEFYGHFPERPHLFGGNSCQRGYAALHRQRKGRQQRHSFGRYDCYWGGSENPDRQRGYA